MAPKQIDPADGYWDLSDRHGALWIFETARYTVALFAEPEDMNPADSMEFADDIAFAREDDPAHWFCAVVAVYDAHGARIGMDVLGGCSYNSFRDFYKPAKGGRGYFPDMVRQAISDARATLAHHRDGLATAA